MRDVGRLLGVEEQLLTTTATADTIVGATEIPVADTAPFAEDGGTLTVHSTLGTQTYVYTAPDDEGLVLPITTPVTVAIREGDDVSVPAAVERYATVRLDDAPDVAVLARIPHALVGRLPAGAYAEDDQDAVVITERTPGNWEVTDVLGREFARAGLADTDWRNDRGVRLISANLETDVAEMLFSSWDFTAENAGPVNTSLPASVSDSYRRVGRTGPASGAIAVTTDFPVKATVNAQASVLNGNDTDGFNVRFYIAVIDPDTDDLTLGRQGTQWCNQGDQTNGRHRQVTRSRHLWWDATPEAPQTRNFWWAFTQDSGTSKNVQLRNLQMVFRLAYSPDFPVPGDTSDERSPTWTSHADTIESYLRDESNAAIDEP